MKTTLLFYILFLFTPTYAQDFYNRDIAKFNPAYSGIDHGHLWNLSESFRTIGSYKFSNLFVNYNTIAYEKHGVGINYINQYSGDKSNRHIEHRIGINYNYQFELKSGKRIALGLAPHAYIENIRYKVDTAKNPELNDVSIQRTNYYLNSGVFYSGRRAKLGVSVTNLAQSMYTKYGEINFIASYYWRLTRSTTIAPSTFFSIPIDSENERLAVTVQIDHKKLNYGIAYNAIYSLRGFSSFIGYRIKKKFMLNYMATIEQLSQLSSNITYRHTLNFQIRIK